MILLSKHIITPSAKMTKYLRTMIIFFYKTEVCSFYCISITSFSKTFFFLPRPWYKYIFHIYNFHYSMFIRKKIIFLNIVLWRILHHFYFPISIFILSIQVTFILCALRPFSTSCSVLFMTCTQHLLLQAAMYFSCCSLASHFSSSVTCASAHYMCSMRCGLITYWETL